MRYVAPEGGEVMENVVRGLPSEALAEAGAECWVPGAAHPRY